MKKGILIFAITLALAAPGFAEKVSGQFKTTKAAIKPTSVVAFPQRSPRDPLKWVKALVLSEGTMNISEALTGLDPHTALVNQEGMLKKNYITFNVFEDGFVSMNATFSEGMVQYIDSTKSKSGEPSITAESLEATFTENSANRLAGRIRTIKPTKTMGGETYELDVNFDTVITQPPAGQKLGAGGGEPGKALMALFAAMNSKNWKGVQAGVSSKILQDDVDPEGTEADNLAAVIDSVSFLLPKGKKMKVLGGQQFQDTAVLELQGEMSEEGGDALYLVRMLKEPSGWRFDRSMMIGLF